MEGASKDPLVPVLANDPEVEAKNRLTNNGESKKKKEKPPPQFGKRFSKMVKLGSGTFGEVWKGYDAELQRDVAIKRFVQVQTSHLGIDMMIIREISFLRQLDHPNIARVLDVLVGKKLDCGSLLLLMELEDLDLFNYQREYQATITLSKVRSIMKQILEACCYLHSNQVMHRDLKPDNILICCSSGIIKVADFGYARTFTKVLGSGGCTFKYSFPIQAPSYKAPEVLLGCDNYSSAVDVWSIGCIFGELLCKGRKLFELEIPQKVEETKEKKSRKTRRGEIDLPIDEKISSASASRVKTETIIASLHAIFQLLGHVTDTNAPALRALPDYGYFKIALVESHPHVLKDVSNGSTPHFRTASLLLLMEQKVRCPAAAQLLLRLLALDPAQRIDCRAALATTDFLLRESDCREDRVIESKAKSAERPYS